MAYRAGRHRPTNAMCVCVCFHVGAVVGSCSIPTRKVDIEEEGSTPFSPKDIVDTATTKLALVPCGRLALTLLVLATTSPFLTVITSLILSLDVR